MSAISASSVRISTLADGTLRLVLDIEPRNAQAAFALFGAPGTALAVAALLPAHQQRAEPAPEPEPERLKGGMIAKWLGMRCGEAEFQQWLRDSFMGQWYDAMNDRPSTTAQCAASVIRAVCSVESRAEFDHDPAAAERFHTRIRGPWAKYQISRGT